MATKNWKRITLNQLSQDTGISRVTLYREIKKGNLIGTKHGGDSTGGGKWYMKQEDVERWAEKYFDA